MDFFRSQNQKNTLKHHKKRLTQEQVKLLEISFASKKKLDAHRKLQLAQELGVPPRQVAIWYQNKRARWKTQSLEFDYNLLHMKLENALAEKREVEKELEQLRGELERAREMLRAAPNQAPDTCTCSTCDEDVNCGLEIDELYACLMGANGSSWD